MDYYLDYIESPTMGLVPAVAVTWNVIDVETVEPPFDTAAPLPSPAEVIVGVGGYLCCCRNNRDCTRVIISYIYVTIIGIKNRANWALTHGYIT